MIMLKIFDTDGLYEYINRALAEETSKAGMLCVTNSEIKGFFGKECGDQWLAIEYFGTANEIKNSFSLLAEKCFRKFFLELILPEEATFADVQVVVDKIDEINVCKDPQMLLATSFNPQLEGAETGLRIVAPRYAYAGEWKAPPPKTKDNLPGWLTGEDLEQCGQSDIFQED